MFDALITKNHLIGWIRSYFSETNQAKAIIGISGGKDSAVCAALCKEALGRERVLGCLMPDGLQPDINFSYDFVRHLDIPHIEINIGNSVSALFDALNHAVNTQTPPMFIERDLLNAPQVRINTPPRVRMTVLYALAAAYGGRVCHTGNKSEGYVGYTTKYGDSAGDFAPLMELTATEVIEIGKIMEIPEVFISRPPTDGLTGKTDEENLGFTYKILDKYIRTGVCEDAGLKAKIDLLHKTNLHKTSPISRFIQAEVSDAL